MRIVKTLAVLVGCAIVGAAAGFIIGGLLVPRDGTLGDGFVILFCTGIGLFISTFVAFVLVARFIWKPGKAETSN